MNKDMSVEELKQLAASILSEAQRTTQIGRRRQPYYQERYAKWAAELIDKVITTGKPYVVPVGDLAFNSIKLQWSQATRYLIDYLDTNGEWEKKLRLLTVEHLRGKGTVVSPKRVSGLLKAYQTEDWKIRFHEWIDAVQPVSSDNPSELPVFERIGVGLTEEDAKYVNDFLKPLEDMFVWSVNVAHDTLKVIRIDRKTADDLLAQDES